MGWHHVPNPDLYPDHFGGPRYNTPAEVRRCAAALATVDLGALFDVDLEAMRQARVYGWIDAPPERRRSYLCGWFDSMRALYDEAARRGQAVFIERT